MGKLVQFQRQMASVVSRNTESRRRLSETSFPTQPRKPSFGFLNELQENDKILD